MLPLILLLALTAAVLTPYAMMLLARHKAVKRIRSVALGSGFKVKALHRGVFFARNRSSKYDLLFASRHKVYAVKLWSSVYPESSMVVCSPDSFYVGRKAAELFEQEGRGSYNFRQPTKRVPKTSLGVKLKGNRELACILLMCPGYKNVARRSGKSILVYEQGDVLFDKKLYYPQGFEALLLENLASGESLPTSR